MKRLWILVFCIALACVWCVGCAPPADLSGLQAQLDQISGDIATLQSDVDGLKAQQGAPADTQAAVPAASQAPAPQPAQSGPAPTEQPAAGQKSAADYGLEDLAARVTDMVGKMEAATAQDFMEVKRQMSALDDELDVCDHAVERDFHQGLLSREDYRAIEQEIDTLENELDRAEESMEFRLGYDD